MITIGMLAAWFMLSSAIFMCFIFVPWLRESMDTDRSVNTAIVLVAQGLAASLLYTIFYAIY